MSALSDYNSSTLLGMCDAFHSEFMKRADSLYAQMHRDFVTRFIKKLSEKLDVEEEELIKVWSEIDEKTLTTTTTEEKKESASLTTHPDPDQTKCLYIRIAGANKGKRCDKKRSKDSDFCYAHKKR